MFLNFKCFHVIILFSICASLLLSELLGFVISNDAVLGNKNLIPKPGNYEERQTEGEIPLLSLLDGFVAYPDSIKPVGINPVSASKKITKRSIHVPKVPHFMIDLYDFLSDKRLLPKFDTARSFSGYSYDSSEDYYSAFSRSITTADESLTTTQHLMFDASHFPTTERTNSAQLILRVTPSKVPVYGAIQNQFIEVFHTAPDGTANIIASRSVDPFEKSWITFNVTREFLKVLQDGTRKLRLEVRVHGEFQDFLESGSTGQAPQLVVLSSTMSRPGYEDDTLLIRMRRSLQDASGEAFMKEQAIVNASIGSSSHVSRRRRSEDEDEEQEEQSNYIVEELGRVRKGKLKKKKNPCRRKPLHVYFAAINYDQWIIAPPSYEAFECTGRCSFPMSAHLSPTKHAIIQTLMHSLEPKQVARASCVPTALNPISVLYVDDDGVVTYKYQYEEMVVSECGCR